MIITDIAKIINETLEVYFSVELNHWVARFKHAETKEFKSSAILSSTIGVGETPNKALEDYTKKISGKFLIFYAMIPQKRKEIAIENLESILL